MLQNILGQIWLDAHKKSEQCPKLILGEAEVLDDFFQKPPRNVAGIHRHGCYDLSAARVGKVTVAAFLVNAQKTLSIEGSFHVARRARREPRHTCVGTSTTTPSETFAGTLVADGRVGFLCVASM